MGIPRRHRHFGRYAPVTPLDHVVTLHDRHAAPEIIGRRDAVVENEGAMDDLCSSPIELWPAHLGLAVAGQLKELPKALAQRNSPLLPCLSIAHSILVESWRGQPPRAPLCQVVTRLGLGNDRNDHARSL